MPTVNQKNKRRLKGRDVCPMHRYYTSTILACEIYTDESGAAIEHMSFDDNAKLKRWQKRYCQNRCRDCPRYKKIIEYNGESRLSK